MSVDGDLTYVLVTSGYDRNNASRGESLDGAVDGLGEGASKRHVHDRLAGNVLLLDIVRDELKALEDTRVGTGTVLAKNLDSHELAVLGDTESGTGNGSSDVGSVTVLISVLEWPISDVHIQCPK